MARLGLAVTRGLLLDLVATDDDAGVRCGRGLVVSVLRRWRSDCAAWYFRYRSARAAFAALLQPVPTPKNLYSASLSERVSRQYCQVMPLHSVRLTAVLVEIPAAAAAGVPHRSASLLLQFGVEPVLRDSRLGASACAPALSTPRSPERHNGSATRS